MHVCMCVSIYLCIYEDVNIRVRRCAHIHPQMLYPTRTSVREFGVGISGLVGDEDVDGVAGD